MPEQIAKQFETWLHVFVKLSTVFLFFLQLCQLKAVFPVKIQTQLYKMCKTISIERDIVKRNN